MKFKNFYCNRPEPVPTILDTETKFVDQSEADRCSLSYQLERFGMDGLQQRLEQTKAQFGYADTRLTSDFASLAQKQAEANSYFMQLPAQIRKEFNHDPIAFYSKIENDPKFMYEKGFISKKLATDLGVLNNVDNIIKDSVDVSNIDNNNVNTTVDNNNAGTTVE